MSAFYEILAPNVTASSIANANTPIVDTSDFVRKEDVKKLKDRVDKVVMTDEERIGIRLRWNRPLIWHYTFWTCKRKYATLGEPVLEYFHPLYKCWEHVSTEEGGEHYIRMPR